MATKLKGAIARAVTQAVNLDRDSSWASYLPIFRRGSKPYQAIQAMRCAFGIEDISAAQRSANLDAFAMSESCKYGAKFRNRSILADAGCPE
mgnify:CR=1 FL=1